MATTISPRDLFPHVERASAFVFSSCGAVGTRKASRIQRPESARGWMFHEQTLLGLYQFCDRTGPVLWGSNVLRFPGEGTRALEAISLIYNSVYQFLVLRGGNS